MRKKAKTYGINFFVASCLQLKMCSHKQLATKKFIPYVLTFILILKIYINNVFCFTFSYLKIWAYGMNQ